MAIRLSGLVSNLDTDAIVQALMSAQSMKKTKLENKITKLEWTQEKWKSLNTKIYSFYTGSVSKMRLQSNYQTKKASVSNTSAAKVTASSSATSGAYSLGISQLASSQYITGGQIPDIKTTVDGKETTSKVTTSTKLSTLGIAEGTTLRVEAGGENHDFKVTNDTTLADYISHCKSAGLNASFDSNQGRLHVSSKNTGSENVFGISALAPDNTSDTVNTSESNGILGKLGLGTIGADGKQASTGNVGNTGSTAAAQTSGMTLVEANDAKYTLNGAEMTSTSNSVTVNGLSIQLQEITSTPMTITVENDTDAVYDMIKTFVKDYNEILGELNDAYNASSARGYEPLTDDEKDAMSESEIEKWEGKIKDSLLRRDTTLGSLISSMKTSVSGTVVIGRTYQLNPDGTEKKDANGNKIIDKKGTTYALTSFGISASVYTENGLLHIDGDSEDTVSADNEDKLRAAIEEDPETVMKVFSGLATDLYQTMQKKMGTSSLSSALTFYNDKDMAKKLTQYKKELSDLEDKLQDLEDRYYSQFTAMESAMATLNSQSSSLSSMIGY